MALSLTQNSSRNEVSASSNTITLTGVQAGALLTITLDTRDNANPTWSVTDSVNGAWTARFISTSGGTENVGVFDFIGASSGDTVISINSGQAAFVQGAVAHEVALGGSTVVFSTFSYGDAAVASSQHTCCDTAVTVAADSWIVGVAVMNANITGGFSPGAGYTEVSDETRSFHQFKVSASSITSEQGAFTSGSNNRTTDAAALAVWSAESAGGGGGTTIRRWTGTVFGAGRF